MLIKRENELSELQKYEFDFENFIMQRNSQKRKVSIKSKDSGNVAVSPSKLSV